MTFGISPPWYRDEVETMAFNGFAMETEELEDKINKIIDILSQADDPYDPQLLRMVAKSCHLNLYSLSDMEMLRIKNGVKK